ncbi:MAG: N-(5'-phosphoribosyl)anthranilate isomerase [Myxococcales bacterium]
MLVKICGITRPEDAVGAVEAGADLIGLNFHARSPRCVSVAVAGMISRAARGAGPVRVVGVFVDADRETIGAAMAGADLDLVQLHGSEPPEWCRALPWPWFKAHRLRTAEDVDRIREWGSDLFLADAWHPTQAGGTGRTADQDLARQAARLGTMLLAGGLTPETVAEAVRTVRPAGVDVASGVESAPGVKDAARMRAFVEAARGS